MAGRKPVFKGRVFEVCSESVVLPSGRRVTRDVVRHPGSVAVLAVDVRGRVLLLRQVRYAGGGVSWEIPAGTLESGESARFPALGGNWPRRRAIGPADGRNSPPSTPHRASWMSASTSTRRGA